MIYQKSNGFKASLSYDIFDDLIYEDSSKNKLTYKKEFLVLFHLQEFENLDPYLWISYTL